MKKFFYIMLILSLAYNLFCVFYFISDWRSVLFHLMSAFCASAWLFVFHLEDIIKDLAELNNYNHKLIGKYIELVTLQDEIKELYEQKTAELNELKKHITL